MARLILSSGEAVGLSSGTYTVFGTATGSETVSFGETAVVTFDASFNAGGDTIDLAGNAADYTVVRSGSQVILTNASGGSFTIPVGTAGATISFDDGDRTLAFNSVAGQIELGDQAVTSTAATVTAGSGAGAGVSVLLTDSPDNPELTSGNDTISGVVDSDVGSGATFTVADTINGGDGTDTLSLIFDIAGATTLPAAALSNIENFDIRNVSGNTLTVDFGLITGEALVNSVISTSNNVFNNLAAGTTVAVTGNGAATNGNTTGNYVATATALSLALADGVTAGNVVISGGAATATSTISSTGAANTIGTLNIAGTAITIDAATALTTGAITSAAATSLTITGAGAVDLDASTLGATIVTVDGSNATGAIQVDPGAVADAGAVAGVDGLDLTITTGAGADGIDLSALTAAANVYTTEFSVSTGDGNDTITIDSALFSASAASGGTIINGGDGVDTLIMQSADAATQSAATAITSVSNIEAITISDTHTGALDVADIQATGIATVTLAAGSNAGAVTSASGLTVNISAANTGTLTLTDVGTGTADSISVVNSATAQTDVYNDQAIVVNGFETVTISTTSGTGTAVEQDIGAITATADTGGTSTVNFVGANSVDVNGIITANVLSFAGLTAQATGTNTVTMTAAGGLQFEYAGATGSGLITGSAGDDVLFGDTGESTNINGGAGNDTITGGSAAETINGGDGNDILDGNGGADTVNGDAGDDQITLGASAAQTADGGAGDDTVFAGTNLAFGQTIAGGDGDDTLDIEAAVAAAAASVLSGFETLVLGATINQDLDVIAANNGAFTNVVLEDDDYTVSSIRSETIVLTDTLAGGGTTLTLEDATGAADSIEIVTQGNADLDFDDAITIAGVETVNITTSDTNTATGDTHTIDLVVTSATTINVSGNAGLNLNGGSENITAVTTMDASGVVLSAANAVTDGVTYVASYNVVGGVTTITGSNGADTLRGHSNTNDTISGGAGADDIRYNGGTDTLTGGAGADNFDIQAITSTVTITDLAVGDTIDVTDLDAAADAAIANGALGAAITLGAAATFQNYLDNAASDTTDVGTNGALDVAIASWFQFDGNTYLVVDNNVAGTFTAGSDSYITISGLVDLSDSVFAGGVLTIA